MRYKIILIFLFCLVVSCKNIKESSNNKAYIIYDTVFTKKNEMVIYEYKYRKTESYIFLYDTIINKNGDTIINEYKYHHMPTKMW